MQVFFAKHVLSHHGADEMGGGEELEFAVQNRRGDMC